MRKSKVLFGFVKSEVPIRHPRKKARKQMSRVCWSKEKLGAVIEI